MRSSIVRTRSCQSPTPIHQVKNQRPPSLRPSRGQRRSVPPASINIPCKSLSLNCFLVIFLITTFANAQQVNWSLSGCSAVNPAFPPLNFQPVNTINPIESCVNLCVGQNQLYSLLSGTQCACMTKEQADASLLTVNTPECNVLCEGVLPCGNPASQRISVYIASPGNTISSTLPAAPTSSTPPLPGSQSTSPSATPTEAVTTTNGSVNAPKSRNIATIVASSISALIFLAGVLGFLVYTIRKRRNLQNLPRIEAGAAAAMAPGGSDATLSEHQRHATLSVPKSASAAALSRKTSKRSIKNALKHGVVPASVDIDVLQSNMKGTGIVVKGNNGLNAILPRTPNMIYSVITGYEPALPDEMTIKRDDVVAVQTLCEDGWALGTNVSTGHVGAFPLGCLISEDQWLKRGFDVPERSKSLPSKIASQKR